VVEQPFFYGPPPEAERTASGIAYQVLTAGTGTTHPRAVDAVTVHYAGWTADGTMFDSSISRGQPVTFGLSEVIPGWTEGVSLMVEGEKTRFWIPANLAYGYAGGGPVGQLCFEIELIRIEEP
jgi:FKBP-type peptidyl-prolyl cis-trans isomerase